MLRVDKKNTKIAFLVFNSSIKICLVLQIEVFFRCIKHGLDFGIRQAVPIKTYSGWIDPNSVDFDNKFCKREIPITEAEEQPFFDKEGNEHVSWYFDMKKSSAWSEQRLESGISRVLENGKKEDWSTLEFTKYESLPYKAKKIRETSRKIEHILL